jgi:pyruvate/2-oxoglutarate dehydrogenase complex dihydrolipoamide dehydrogenase (E3) component
MSDTTHDAIVIGGGPGGEVAVNTLVKGGKRVALVEQELIGGECTNWGCIPSKTLLRPAELIGACDRTAGVKVAQSDWPSLASYRDYMVSDHDDGPRADRYRKRGVTVVKAPGRILSEGVVEAGDEQLRADAVIVATGSEAAIPPIPGLAEAGYWTNREATALADIPTSVVIIGGGAVGVELAQFLARFGAQVALIEGAERLSPREPEQIGEALHAALMADGIDVCLGAQAESVRRDADRRVVTLAGGGEISGEALIVAAGRRPRTAGLGLEDVGVTITRRGIEVDDRCQAAAGVWAIGDVTGIAAFTHVAKYQGRIAAMDILGHAVKADYRAVPRVTFTDPEIAAVGITSEDEARSQGIRVATSTIKLASIARSYTYERDPRGAFGVLVDSDRGVLIGAWAVGPLAGEWIHQAVLAVRAEISIDVLEDTMAQFPTFSEAMGTALRALPDANQVQANNAVAAGAT